MYCFLLFVLDKYTGCYIHLSFLYLTIYIDFGLSIQRHILSHLIKSSPPIIVKLSA